MTILIGNSQRLRNKRRSVATRDNDACRLMKQSLILGRKITNCNCRVCRVQITLPSSSTNCECKLQFQITYCNWPSSNCRVLGKIIKYELRCANCNYRVQVQILSANGNCRVHIWQLQSTYCNYRIRRVHIVVFTEPGLQLLRQNTNCWKDCKLPRTNCNYCIRRVWIAITASVRSMLPRTNCHLRRHYCCCQLSWVPPLTFEGSLESDPEGLDSVSDPELVEDRE